MQKENSFFALVLRWALPVALTCFFLGAVFACHRQNFPALFSLIRVEEEELESGEPVTIMAEDLPQGLVVQVQFEGKVIRPSLLEPKVVSVSSSARVLSPERLQITLSPEAIESFSGHQGEQEHAAFTGVIHVFFLGSRSKEDALLLKASLKDVRLDISPPSRAAKLRFQAKMKAEKVQNTFGFKVIKPKTYLGRGLLVTDVEPGLSAEKVGLKVGDLLIEADHLSLYEISDLSVFQGEKVSKEVHVNLVPVGMSSLLSVEGEAQMTSDHQDFSLYGSVETGHTSPSSYQTKSVVFGSNSFFSLSPGARDGWVLLFLCLLMGGITFFKVPVLDPFENQVRDRYVQTFGNIRDGSMGLGSHPHPSFSDVAPLNEMTKLKRMWPLPLVCLFVLASSLIQLEGFRDSDIFFLALFFTLFILLTYHLWRVPSSYVDRFIFGGGLQDTSRSIFSAIAKFAFKAVFLLLFLFLFWRIGASYGGFSIDEWARGWTGAFSSFGEKKGPSVFIFSAPSIKVFLALLLLCFFVLIEKPSLLLRATMVIFFVTAWTPDVEVSGAVSNRSFWIRLFFVLTRVMVYLGADFFFWGHVQTFQSVDLALRFKRAPSSGKKSSYSGWPRRLFHFLLLTFCVPFLSVWIWFRLVFRACLTLAFTSGIVQGSAKLGAQEVCGPSHKLPFFAGFYGWKKAKRGIPKKREPALH